MNVLDLQKMSTNSGDAGIFGLSTISNVCNINTIVKK